MTKPDESALFFSALARCAKGRSATSDLEKQISQSFGNNASAKRTAEKLVERLHHPHREITAERRKWLELARSEDVIDDARFKAWSRRVMKGPFHQFAPGIRVADKAPDFAVPKPVMKTMDNDQPAGHKYRIEFAGIYCKEEMEVDQWTRHDEPYVLFTMLQRYRDPWSTRSWVYEDLPGGADGIDSGDDFRELPPLLTLFGENSDEPANETAIIATMMEHDQGDPNAWKDEIEMVVKAAQVVAASEGIVVPDEIAALVVELINKIVDTDDDLIGVNSAVLDPSAFHWYANYPLIHFKKQLNYHFHIYHTDDQAKYYSFYRIIEDGKRPPLALARNGIGAGSAVARTPDRLDVFARLTDGGIYTAAWDPDVADGKWRGWWPVVGDGSAFNSTPQVVSRGPNNLDVFARGKNTKGIFSAAWDGAVAGGAWRGWWRHVGGQGTAGGNITAVSRGANKLDAFIRGSNKGIYTAAWDAAQSNGEWRGWWRIVDGAGEASSDIAAVARAENKLDLFIRGTSGHVFTAAWDAEMADGAWRGWWQVLDLKTAKGTAVAAVARHDKQLDIFAVGMDGGIYTAAWNPDVAEGWRGWWRVLDLKVRSGTSVTAVSREPEQLDLFAIGTDDRVYTASWNPNIEDGKWLGWWAIGNFKAGAMQSVAAVTRRPAQLDVFAQDEAGMLWTAAWDANISGAQWRGWWRIP